MLFKFIHFVACITTSFFLLLLPNSIFYNYKNHAPVPKRKNSRQGSHWSIELMLGRNFEDSYLQSGEMLYLDLDSTFHKRPLCLFLSMVIGFPFERSFLLLGHILSRSGDILRGTEQPFQLISHSCLGAQGLF